MLSLNGHHVTYAKLAVYFIATCVQLPRRRAVRYSLTDTKNP